MELVTELGKTAGFELVKAERLAWPDNLAEEMSEACQEKENAHHH